MVQRGIAGESVLIVEDDPTMLRLLEDRFHREGFRVQVAADGQVGLELALGKDLDLVVLDVMLPGVHGFEICRRVRSAGLETPIMFLTAKGQEPDVVLGLNLGGDDYVIKPFRILELLARARALIRRRAPAQTRRRFGDFELDLEAHRLVRAGEEIALTPKEIALLEYLCEHTGRARTREQILDAVWGHGVFVNNRSVDRCVTTVRKKIEDDPSRPVYLRTVREVGYRFEGLKPLD
ncbi:MAG: response regulator transcription factor [Deltaproteobacteria bacterium]|nr:response regulator transcription factor [Deltaproteobacteria bacterium]